MRYGQPSVASVLEALRAGGATRVLCCRYIHKYAAATTASAADRWLAGPPAHAACPTAGSSTSITTTPATSRHWPIGCRRNWRDNERGERLILSFHGVPQRSFNSGTVPLPTAEDGAACWASGSGLAADQWQVTFRAASAKRSGSSLIRVNAAPPRRRRMKSVDVFCPGFVADCLETLEEIDARPGKRFSARAASASAMSIA